MALLAMLAPNVSNAYTKTVICDGCGETEYTKSALRYSDDADAVLIIDAGNAQLRKYQINSSADREMKRYRKTVVRITPSTHEWELFGDTVKIYDKIRFYLDSCGPGGAGDWLVPDFNFEAACEQHDACYAAGGTDEDRSACDHQLYRDIWAMGGSKSMAATYFLAVRAAGWMYFNYSTINNLGSFGSFGSCAYLEVCDYTSKADIPW